MVVWTVKKDFTVVQPLPPPSLGPITKNETGVPAPGFTPPSPSRTTVHVLGAPAVLGIPNPNVPAVDDRAGIYFLVTCTNIVFVEENEYVT